MRTGPILAAPGLIWFSFFLVAPLSLVLLVSFAQRGTYGGIEWVWTLENFARLGSPEILRILLRSLKMALLTGLFCVGFGFVAAWAMVTAPPRWRNLFWILVLLPFFSNLIIRVYALKSVVAYSGPLPVFLRWAGIPHDPFALTTNETLVWVGLLTTYLPFAILPLAAAFERFDFSLVEAAQDLGASQGQVFLRVLVPAFQAPLMASFLLVSIPVLGEYILPDLLGGAQTQLVGNLITEQFLRARDWPFGAALSVGLLLMLALMAAGFRIFSRGVRS